MNKNFFFTSESVSEGHPDKVCDQISDAVLDACLAEDPRSRVACESLIKSNLVVLAGEITTNIQPNFDKIVRNTLEKIGYVSDDCGTDFRKVQIIEKITKQSLDIALGVNEDTNHLQGAGDQGIMFGYACDETDEYMPLAIFLAHKLVQSLANLRHTGSVDFLRPDAKSQVTIFYENNIPKYIDTVVVSTQHSPNISEAELREYIIKQVIEKVIPDNLKHEKIKYLVNPTGRFIVGGPLADAGVTGRKIIVDTYGGAGRHGGGAFSGKDPSKVDRSAAYAARYVAKNIVAAGLAKKCEIQLSYAIGVAEPVSIYLNTFGTSKVDEQKIIQKTKEIVSFAPRETIKQLDLLKPIYSITATYGHFGRRPSPDGHFSWEQTNLATELKKLL
ncbi:MAG: methionine adenosyltransferase [Deltaproteobacteria bacterium]|jgi:S-adenosylmethionine synthetase|nr:methionine adenosyltransferase [Deltaproteobacteria bacterium]